MGQWHFYGRGEVRTKILVGKLEGKKPLGRHRFRWENNIKMYLKEIVLVVVDWIDEA